MNNFDYVVSLLESEKARLEKDRDYYQMKKPPGCCPIFTLEKRKPYADEATARIKQIQTAIALLRPCTDAY